MISDRKTAQSMRHTVHKFYGMHIAEELCLVASVSTVNTRILSCFPLAADSPLCHLPGRFQSQ